MDRVSVVMPAYNATATLEASMRSALAQTHADVELLVVDDCSTDGTWDVVQRLAAEDPRVVPIRQPRNAGVAAARAAGIEAATGRYIAFLDSDDRWYPDKLAIQLAAMRTEGAAVGYAAYERVDAAGRVLSRVRPPPRAGYARMLKGNCIGNLTGIYDRAIGEPRFSRMGHEDYAFWLQVVRMAGQAVCAPPERILASYLVRPGSLSANKLRAARWQWRIYRDVEGLNPAQSAYYMMHYARNALGKRR